MTTSYQNAPATKLLATACACCGRPLVDAVSVEMGIGPDCRAKYGVDDVQDAAARDEANALVHAVAKKGVEKKFVIEVCRKLEALGFVVLASRIMKRFRMTLEATKLNVDALRAEYKMVRGAFCYDNCDAKEFDALVKAHNPTSPEEFVAAAKNVACKCKRCGGSGKYVTRVENGQARGPGGDCFRCQGKGFQDAEDVKRNRWYDIYAMNKAARAMFAA